MSKEISFTIGGKLMHLSRDTVLRKLKKVEPEGIQTHAVEVDGKKYPMKQAFATVMDLDRLDFTTNQARTQFKRLDFKVIRVG